MPTATYTISDLAREFDLTPRAMRFYEDMERFLLVLGQHRAQLEAQLAELQATLGEISQHEKDARALLARLAPQAAGRRGATPASA